MELIVSNTLRDNIDFNFPTQGNSETIKILLIDDNNTIISAHYKLFKDYLTSKNLISKFEIIKLNDGIEGLYEVYKDHVMCSKSIKLIVSDQDMNFLKGSELYSLLKDKFKSYLSYFVIVSALLDNEFSSLIQSIGVDHYSKPLSKGMIDSIYNKYLSKALIE